MYVAGICVLVLMPVLVLFSCGEKQTPIDTNLLKNSSFEAVKDGLPRHWRLADFKGLEGESEVEYGIDNTTAVDGLNSWHFKGDPGTRRWYVLTQEVEGGANFGAGLVGVDLHVVADAVRWIESENSAGVE